MSRLGALVKLYVNVVLFVTSRDVQPAKDLKCFSVIRYLHVYDNMKSQGNMQGWLKKG